MQPALQWTRTEVKADSAGVVHVVSKQSMSAGACGALGEERQSEVRKWYAVQTFGCRERVVDKLLRGQGICSYLPLIHQKRRWSDRIKTIETPLFPGYLFVKLGSKPEEYWQVNDTRGVSSILGDERGPVSVGEEEIQAVARMIAGGAPLGVVGGLQEGQSVRVKAGLLKGLEGRFLCLEGRDYLAIHVAILGRSVLASVKCCDVEPN